MNLFSIITLVFQLILICGSKYYEYLANIELEALAAAPITEVVSILSKLQYYSDLENYAGYFAGALWIIVIIAVNLNKVANTIEAQLSIVLPALVSLLMIFI